jgi:hypothetical protein
MNTRQQATAMPAEIQKRIAARLVSADMLCLPSFLGDLCTINANDSWGDYAKANLSLMDRHNFDLDAAVRYDDGFAAILVKTRLPLMV